MHKLKIEFCDGHGEQVTIALKGPISKERLLRLLELFEVKNQETSSNSQRTIRESIMEIINSKLSNKWFTSKEVASIYFEQFHESIKPSTISTYLSRLYSGGFLERIGNRSCWQYRLVPKTSTKNVEPFLKELYRK